MLLPFDFHCEELVSCCSGNVPEGIDVIPSVWRSLLKEASNFRLRKIPCFMLGVDCIGRKQPAAKKLRKIHSQDRNKRPLSIVKAGSRKVLGKAQAFS